MYSSEPIWMVYAWASPSVRTSSWERSGPSNSRIRSPATMGYLGMDAATEAAVHHE